jgi:hypothetical protein
MNAMTCDRFRATVIGSEPVLESLAAWPDLHAHAAECETCRHWFATFAEGAGLWRTEIGADVAAPVMAATGGTPCDRARVLLASSRDAALNATDADLLASHAARCTECRIFAATLAAITDALPTLAEWDPGPGFAAAVLARTSLRPADATWGDRWRAVWQRLVQRPRFAWETAYVVTLCWLLIFGHPINALDWTTARVSAVARETVPARVRVVQTQVVSWRERASADVDRAVSLVASGRASVENTASAAQRQATAWWTRLAADVVSLLESGWHAMVAWVNGLLTDVRESATEPPGPPARSSE